MAAYRMKTVIGRDGQKHKIPVKVKRAKPGTKKKKGAKKKGAKMATTKAAGGSLRALTARVARVEQTQRQTVQVLGAVVAKVREHDRKINALAGLAGATSPRRLGGR